MTGELGPVERKPAQKFAVVRLFRQTPPPLKLRRPASDVGELAHAHKSLRGMARAGSRPGEPDQRLKIVFVRRMQRRDITAPGFASGLEIDAAPAESLAAELHNQHVSR